MEKFITESEYNVGLDCAILMNPKVWEASGHIGGFPTLLWTANRANPVIAPTTLSKTGTPKRYHP